MKEREFDDGKHVRPIMGVKCVFREFLDLQPSARLKLIGRLVHELRPNDRAKCDVR